MGNTLNPGTSTDSSAFVDRDLTSSTMVQAMEAAFLDQWDAFNPGEPEPTPKQLEAMRLLFVAVAQGVVQHLSENFGAFIVTVNSTGHSHSNGEHVHGDGSHTHSGGTHNHSASISSISTTNTTA